MDAAWTCSMDTWSYSIETRTYSMHVQNAAWTCSMVKQHENQLFKVVHCPRRGVSIVRKSANFCQSAILAYYTVVEVGSSTSANANPLTYIFH